MELGEAKLEPTYRDSLTNRFFNNSIGPKKDNEIKLISGNKIYAKFKFKQVKDPSRDISPTQYVLVKKSSSRKKRNNSNLRSNTLAALELYPSGEESSSKPNVLMTGMNFRRSILP